MMAIIVHSACMRGEIIVDENDVNAGTDKQIRELEKDAKREGGDAYANATLCSYMSCDAIS